MQYEWDLTPIYRGLDDPAYAADLAELEAQGASLRSLTEKLGTIAPEEGLKRGLAILERSNYLVNKLYIYPSLLQSADTKNTRAGAAMTRCLAADSASATPEAAFWRWVAELPNLDALLDGDESLADYRYLLQRMKRKSCHLLQGDGEEAVARLYSSGSGAWSELQQYLTSTVKVSYRSRTLNLSAVRALAHDPDPQVRRDAYEAELACYGAIADPVAYALNSVKLATISECRMRGYASPLEMTLESCRMSRRTLDAMMEAIDDALPQFRRYLECKATALGHTAGLPWYDLFAPMGSADTAATFTPEQAGEYLVSLFSGFDADLAAMVQQAFDERWIDFYPRPGKAGGAFCAGVRGLNQSRILTNFCGKMTDVDTLAHELGHAFHNRCIQSHRELNRSYPMQLAETASTFNECVVMSAAIRDASDDAERLLLLESQLQDTTQIICDILSRYRFETEVFARREQEFLDAPTLCDIMTATQRSAYGGALDEKALHPYMWVCKDHYYGRSFYNFPYAFGGLFARGLYARYLEEGAAFVPKYKRLLYTTTVASAEDTAAVAGINLSDKSFWSGALQIIADQITQACELMG